MAETICPNHSARMFSSKKPRNKNYILHQVYMYIWQPECKLISKLLSIVTIFENFSVLITLRNLFFPILPELFARIFSSPNLGGAVAPCPPARTPMVVILVKLNCLCS